MSNLLVNIVIGLLVGVVSGIGVHLLLKIDTLRKGRHLPLLLNFPQNEKLFIVYPPRPREYQLLPTASTEDFMGINNLISALVSIGWDSEKFIVRDTTRLSEKEWEKNNIVVICSPKANTLSKEIQEKLRDNKVHFYYFTKVIIEDVEQWVISDGNGFFPSPTYKTNQKYRQESDSVSEEIEIKDIDTPLHAQSLEDLAVITKIRNPWNPSYQILLVAGLRGIGSWGAAETLKKWYDVIYRAKKRSLVKYRKSGSFSALIKIYYRNSDIVGVELINLIEIDDLSHSG
jgi:hypothetical protein